jgi:hypothetical protein
VREIVPEDIPEPPPPVWPSYWRESLQFGLRHWFWVMMAMLTAGLGVWWVTQGDTDSSQFPAMTTASAPAKTAEMAAKGAPARVPRNAAATAAVAAKPSAAQMSAEGAPAQAPRPFTPAAPAGQTRPLDAPPPIAAHSISTESPAAMAGLSAMAPQLPPAPANAAASASAFAGDWRYQPSPGGRTPANLYPATYVEFVVSEENGNLTGVYHAHYTVPNQNISPEVRFRVQGKLPGAKSCKLAWASDDGARGEAQVTLRSDNQLSITWWTTVFSNRAALSSGMAELSRQQNP